MNMKAVGLLLMLAFACAAIVVTATVFPDTYVSDGAGKNGVRIMKPGEDRHPVLLGDPVDGGHPSKYGRMGNFTG